MMGSYSHAWKVCMIDDDEFFLLSISIANIFPHGSALFRESPFGFRLRGPLFCLVRLLDSSLRVLAFYRRRAIDPGGMANGETTAKHSEVMAFLSWAPRIFVLFHFERACVCPHHFHGVYAGDASIGDIMTTYSRY